MEVIIYVYIYIYEPSSKLLKGGYIRGCIGEYCRGNEVYTRNLDYSVYVYIYMYIFIQSDVGIVQEYATQ